MNSSPDLEILFRDIKNDDLHAAMQPIIEYNLFNFKYPRYFKSLSQYPLLTHRCPVISIAAYFGSYDVFRFLVANGSNIRQSDENCMNSVGFAIAGNHPEICEMLLEMHMVDTLSSNDCFLFAAKFNCYEMFQLIAKELTLNPGAYDLEGKQCIHYAALNGNIEILTYLLEHGADINAETQKDKRTPIMFAAVNKNPEAIKFLLTVPKIDASSKSKFGDNAVILAAAPGYLENIKILIEEGKVNINETNLNGATALHNASINNRIDVVKYLLSRPDIDVTIQDMGKNNALLRAAFLQNIEIVKTFLQMVSPENFSGICIVEGVGSAVHVAAEVNNLELLKIFIEEFKIDVNANYCIPCTPLAMAINKGSMDCIKYLIGVPGRKVTQLPVIHNYRFESVEPVNPEIMTFLKENAKDVIDIIEDQIKKLEEKKTSR